jgi:hypothetical protein
MTARPSLRPFQALPILVAVALGSAPFASAQATSQPTAQQGPATQPSEPGKMTPPTDKRASKEVDVKKECGVLADVFKHRTALHFLKNDKEAREAILKTIDPEAADQIKAIVEKDERFTELDYHFVEKIRNCEQRILFRLRADKFQGVADLVEAVKDKNYPNTVAFANLLGTVDLNLRHAIRANLVENDDSMKESGRRLTAEALRTQGTSGHAIDEIAKTVWKDGKPDDFPASWFDRSSEVISYEFGLIPDAKDFPRVDLAQATRDQLLALPQVDVEIADAILKYRKKNGIQGPEELRFVEPIPAHLVEPLQSLCTVERKEGPAAPKKKWTVMVYLNAANNLEPFGIEDMNEMESVGSTRDVNIVVECARFRGKQAVKPNSAYLSNPFSDFSGAFYFGLDSTPATRRYYILKDSDKVRVQSVLLENVGETDAGRPEPLADFGKWAVEKYPAEHYALVIWNHGGGWSGVSSDDNTHHGMDLPDVRWALEKICEKTKSQGKDKIDLVDFDACLMATIEVAYELAETTDFLVASQETEPGAGMQYTDYLKWITTYPESPSSSFAKNLVETYVKSYAPEGSQAGKDRWNGGETKSSIRSARVADLKAAVEDVAKILLLKPDLLGEVAEEIVRDTRKYMGRQVDLHDFFAKLVERDKADKNLAAAVERALELVGYPNEGKDRLVNEVVIKRRSAGAVIWGFNGWAMPPRNLAPFLAGARYAKTPLSGPDEKGNYVAKIKFPPTLKNPKTGKFEMVKEINYRFEDEQEKRTAKDFDNTFFTAEFAPEAAVTAEGHNIGNNRSHGISIYFPAYLGFDKNYRRLKFAKDSSWAELCEKFPIKTLKERAPVAVLGANHVTKATREKLGGLVVREDLEKALYKLDCGAETGADLKKLGQQFDCIKDPRPYGDDWAATLEHYKHGVVILDNHAGGELGNVPEMPDFMEMLGMGGFRPRAPRVVAPEGRQVAQYLRAGGNVLLSSPGITRAIWDTPLYRDQLGLEYVRTWNRGYGFKLASAATTRPDQSFEIEVSRPGESLTVIAPREGFRGRIEPFATLPDGQWIGAKIAPPDSGENGDPRGRAVVLGFYLADVKGAEARQVVLKEAMSFLRRNAQPPAKLVTTETRPAGREETPVGSSSSGGGEQERK